PIYPGTSASAAPVAGIPGSIPGAVPGPIERYAKVIHDTQFAGDFFFERPLPTPVGIALVMFWPAWILFRRRRLDVTLAILVGFAIAYFAYWIHTFPVLRYALPALVVLFLLTAARFAESICAETSRFMRALLLSSAAYTLT